MAAITHIGPVTTLYIDMDQNDPTSNMLTIKLDGTSKMVLKQNGDVETVGNMVFSTVDGMLDS